MTIYTYGYKPEEFDCNTREAEAKLFSENFFLIREHEKEILSCAEYFFCQLSFAWCSWLLVDGDGPLFLGYLIHGWRQGVLKGKCSECHKRAFMTRFGCGFPMSGGYSYSVYCPSCNKTTAGREAHGVMRLIEFARGLRKRFPFEIREWEEYDGFKFQWGGNGFRPARKKRLKTIRTAEPISLVQIVEEIASDTIRVGDGPNVNLMDLPIRLRFGNRM